MKIFSAQQIRAWDQYTMEHEPISSIDLMERAAEATTNYLTPFIGSRTVIVFCGLGNNGGDGLAVARLLSQKGFNVSVYVLATKAKGSSDFECNLKRLNLSINQIVDASDFPKIEISALVVDALFGSGLNRPLAGIAEKLVDFLNTIPNQIVSIDVPSGIFLDQSSNGNSIVKSHLVLTFQSLKYCFLLPENAPYIENVTVLDIGLHADYERITSTDFQMITLSDVQKYYQPRSKFSHKGVYGHCLLVAGNQGKMGAAIIATRACLNTGVGLLSISVPLSESQILPIAVPEAMTIFRENEVVYSKFQAIGFGPGLGTDELPLLKSVLSESNCPLILDADGLNMLSQNPSLLQLLPTRTILTPHPKEFDRLFGLSNNDDERIRKAIAISAQNPWVVILKGHYTLVAYQGKGYFNTTGNAGMATGGSGDMLTGMIAALLSQKYSILQAAILGVYLHGKTADLAFEDGFSYENIIPSVMEQYIGSAFKELYVA